MEIPGDGEQPGPEARVGSKRGRACHQAQPGFFEQVLGDVAPTGQPRQEVEQAHVERIVDDVECRGIAGAQAGDQRELGIPVHACHNAPARGS
jgi:hypothetical protein